MKHHHRPKQSSSHLVSLCWSSQHTPYFWNADINLTGNYQRSRRSFRSPDRERALSLSYPKTMPTLSFFSDLMAKNPDDVTISQDISLVYFTGWHHATVGRKKQLPLSLTEGRISLKVLRFCPICSILRWVKLELCNAFSTSSLLLLLLDLPLWKKTETSYGGLWTFKAKHITLTHLPKNFKAPASVALLQLWVGLWLSCRASNQYPQTCLQFSGAYQMGHWMKIMKPVAITWENHSLKGARILEQCNPWQVILHFCWLLHGQDKTSEGEHFM